MEAGKSILLVAQKSAAKDEPSAEDLYDLGCIANILQMLKLPDGTVKVLVEGVQRARVVSVEDLRTLFRCQSPARCRWSRRRTTRSRRCAGPSSASSISTLSSTRKIPPEILSSLSGIEEPGRLADTIAAHLPLKLEQKQEILEMFDGRPAPRTFTQPARDRAGHPPGGKAHPRPRQAPDGEEPARVLPQRAGQGHPEGARRGRGWRRSRGDGKEDQGFRHDQGSHRQGPGRAQEASP